MSIYSSKRKSRRASRSQLGHLKLSVYEDSSALIIHGFVVMLLFMCAVYEARGLMRGEGVSLDTYVKLYLLPDPHKLTKEKTKILRQKDPVFNEKFTYLLNGEEDLDKKLFISVWSRHSTSRNEMIGCMTFPVAEILGPDKVLNGWYQVLDEVKGLKEYHRIPSTITRTERVPAEQGVRRFAVTLIRSERGYGFNVDGHSPVFISKILEGLPADEAGMLVGDYIVEVEGTDVTRANAKLVVSIFKKCPQVIHLILQRNSHTHFPTGHAQYASLSLRRPPKRSSLPAPQFHTQSQLMLNSRPAQHRASLQLSSSSGLIPEYHSHRITARRASAPQHDISFTQPDYQPSIAENGHMTDQVISQWPSSSLARSREQLNASQGHLRAASTTGLGPQQPNFTPQESYGGHTFTQPLHKAQSSYTFTQPLHEAHSSHTFTQPLHEAHSSHTFTQPLHEAHSSHTFTQPLHEAHSSHTFTQPLHEAHSSHTFTQPLHEAHTFTQPLHEVPVGRSVTQPHGQLVKTLSPSNKLEGVANLESTSSSIQDSSQNEETGPVDWEALGVMAQQRQKAVNALLTAEQAHWDMLKMGMETYVEPLRFVVSAESHQKMFLGLRELYTVSTAILSQLKARQIPYTSDSAPVPVYMESLADIYWIHLKELMECLKVTLTNSGQARQEISTSMTFSEQFAQLIEDSVVKDKKQTVYSFVEAANDYVPKLSRSMFNILYVTPLSHSDQRHLHSITEELVSVCRDKELMSRWGREEETMKRLQLCVGFGGKVKQFRVQTPGRMLIHEGELLLVERRRKKKVWILLLSDLLLVTKRQGKVLTVVEDPLPLEELSVQDFHYTDSNEIQISSINKNWRRLFRAVGESDKDVWLTKIKERASGSLSRQRKQDKSRSGLQPHIQSALKKQSQQLQASAVAMDTASPAVLSSVSRLGNGGTAIGTAETDGTGEQKEVLKRGSSKRRSLFNVGRDKKDKQASDGESKVKRSFRGKVSPPKTPSLSDVSVETLKKWKISFDSMIHSENGLLLFEEHLKAEFSEENIQFWKACERFKTVPVETLAKEARVLYEEFILPRSPKQVNLDHQTVQEIEQSLSNPDHSLFIKAQHQIFILMQRDSYKRFIDSEPFQSALKK